MEKFIIKGGIPLNGKVKIQGAKNAALPILASCILAEGIHQINDVPNLLDIEVMIEILEAIGASISFENNSIKIDTRYINSTVVPQSLMSQMRSSIFLMGPLLARFNEVTVSKPGGCAIGDRKIDLHLKGLKALGAVIEEQDDFIICKTKELVGNTIFLDFPSVGATENLMMAATKAKGETRIINAAKEPEIIDLQNFLNKMGAKIVGAGTNTIIIKGVEKLVPNTYQIIPDRIVAGTILVAVGIAGGKVEINNVIPDHLSVVIDILERMGVEINKDNDIIIVERARDRLKSVGQIVTAPYPGFPTDMQAQFMSLLSLANGTSIVEENVFDSRYKHINELKKMGANIQFEQNRVYIQGTKFLHGSEVTATDLRAGAALILAGLVAHGTTTINQIYHIDRGYEKIDELFRTLGAKIVREA